MPGEYSGRFGVIDGVSDITLWSASETSEPVSSVTSATRVATRRSSGILQASGNYAGKGGIPVLKPWALFAFKGYTAPEDEVYGSDGVTVEGNVYATTITINLPFSANEDVNHTVDFNFDQEITIGTGFYEDPGPPLESSICPCKIEYGESGSEVEIEYIANATLTFTIATLDYINSSTNCTTGRKPGPLDWTLDIEIQNNVRPIPIQSDERLKVWVNTTQFFVLEFGHLHSYSDLNVNVETGEIISQTMNWSMQSHKQSDLATIGAIYWPDNPTTPIWPPVAPTVVATVQGRNDSPE